MYSMTIIDQPGGGGGGKIVRSLDIVSFLCNGSVARVI